MTHEAISAQLLAGWVFMAGLGLMFVIAAVVAAWELIKSMGAKPMKPIDRTGFLANLIYEIVEGKHEHRPAVVVGGVAWQTWALGGGAKLWWDAKTRRLMAMRPNGPLQAGEDKTFTAHIQKAGYTFRPGIKACTAVYIDDGLNAWRGVAWILADAVPAGVGEDEAVQESLL